MVNTTGLPLHEPEMGVIVIFAMIGALVLLMAVNTGILPVPLAGKPIEG
jgi:hypothetical protein